VNKIQEWNRKEKNRNNKNKEIENEDTIAALFEGFD